MATASINDFWRFIPAGAGNTQPVNSHHPAGTVYPRWRGEHRYSRHPECPPRGLSPLARGTPLPSPEFVFARRFIPAGAGNTTSSNFFLSNAPVYPRWRGEHTWSRTVLPARRGLSPLARGTLQVMREKIFQRRFIPAGAGNTSRKSFH